MIPRLIVWPAVVTTVLIVSACVTQGPSECEPCAPPDKAPVVVAPPPSPLVPEPDTAAPRLQATGWGELPGWQTDDLAQAWPALQRSCTALASDARWQAVCTAADALGAQPGKAQVQTYLKANFRPWRVRNGDGSADGLVTGYYEPLIRGSKTRSARSRWPIYGVPDDLITVDLVDVRPELKGVRLRGRLDGRRLVPYWTRGELAAQGERFDAPILAWADDPIALFFLQVQGSGRIALSDGSFLRIGYADHNGHPYKSIGRWLIDTGEMTLADASMQGIQRWARAHPQRLRELLDQNPSFVFFRELPANDDGPLGALGVPLVAGRSIAVDTRAVPLGAPVFLATTQPNSTHPLRRLVMAQDTGGAIKGGVRADFFWGFGDAAGAQAGRMRQRGQMWVLLPKAWTAPAEK